MNKLQQEKKGQAGILFGVLVGFVSIAVILVLLVLLTYTFGTVWTGLEGVAVSNTVNNDTGWINATTFTLSAATAAGEPRTVSFTSVINASNGSIIPANAYTFNDATFGITNATETNWDNVSFTYNYINNSASQTASRDAQTNTTRAIPLVGILLVILAVGVLITILIVSLTGGGRRS